MNGRNCTFDPTDLNESPESVASRTETTNEAGGRAFEPDSDRVGLYKNVLNNLLEDTYYQDATEQFTDVVDEFMGVAPEDTEFPLQLATYARHEGGYRDIAQVLLVLSANYGRNELVADVGDDVVSTNWNASVPRGGVAPFAEELGEHVAAYAPSIIDRADEFNTVVSLQKNLFGKPVPRPLRRGVEDALHKRYFVAEFPDGSTERLTYVEPDDGSDREWCRFAEALEFGIDNGHFEPDDDIDVVAKDTKLVDNGYIFDEYTFSKYAQRNRAVSLHDVINLVRPNPRSDERDDTFGRIVHGELDSHPDVDPLRNERTWESERSSDTTIETFRFDVPDLDEIAGRNEYVERETGVFEVKGSQDADGTITFSVLNATPVDEDSFDDTIVTVESVEQTWQDIRTVTLQRTDVPATPLTVTVESDLTERDEWRHRLDDMGLMARVRNLRNMREAGLGGDEIFDYDGGAFARRSENRVQEHQMFPARFYQAFKACEDNGGLGFNRFDGTISIEADVLDDYSEAWLESAIDASVANLPDTLSNTFTAIDLSGSMNRSVSDDSDMARAEIACLFGSAVAKSGADAGAFGDTFRRFDLQDGVRENTGTLDLATKFYEASSAVGNATNGHLALEWATENDVEYDQFVFFTDEQLWDTRSRRVGTSLKDVWDDYVEQVNPDADLFVVDLASYGTFTAPEGYHNVHQISGWHDNIVEYIDSVDQIQDVVAEIAEIQPGDY